MKGQSAVCTLTERDYEFGVGSLINSLYAHGYRGPVFVGYRGRMPAWARAAREHGAVRELCVGDGMIVRFVELATTWHPAQYKPEFMLRLLAEFCPDVQRLFFFDPDIVITCCWDFYEAWAANGVALCEDAGYGHMPADHPVRLSWNGLIDSIGFQRRRDSHQYFNSGFLGVRRDCVDILETWRKLMAGISESGVDLTVWLPGNRTQPFQVPDQDALNVAVMLTSVPLSTIGPEGMGFSRGGFTMLHATGAPKPWAGGMIRRALKGYPPGLAVKAYWQHARSPIRLYSDFELARKLADLRIAAAIGRFMRRS
jgi:hypothetical protein